MNIKMGVAKAGIKPSGDYDILVLKFPPSVYSLVLTQNSLAAAPVIYDRMISQTTDRISAIVVNSGNANAATGEEGLKNAEKMAQIVEELLDIDEPALVFSTGVIGVQLPMEKVEKGIKEACNSLTDLDLKTASRAISTTDSFEKYYQTEGEIDGKSFKVWGIAKGAGMIHPNMATMLAYIFTDVQIDKHLLDRVMKVVVERSFNSIDVDGCESTNDSFLIVATGEGKLKITEENKTPFAKKVLEVATNLAKMIVKDGEGATKLIQINVFNAKDREEAKKVGEAIALSNLFKTAMFGNDPNWGRILSAVGQLHLDIDFSRVKLYIGDFLIYSGEPVSFDREGAVRYLKENDEVNIYLYLERGDADWTYYTCDLTYKYVEINAEYTT
ncbi:bifunctional glutamate N-acetyltransferase/amino-acid acetyltransferase ArgJ [Persephonella atlantica]|uniref:Arginine biosynthesis bifunctional protein ArgJ n=1 Tax=Persephonella atlantica TaxID=2699429 RepID=A0ABS1GIC5_9AQUI|nr:bifunctional glutamate N-acetyltransferase/amino-acid acetyltransferase ArgJ [Persephonella atlantica]MBK3332621.1 bifunctional glutamate N-acetyltransferase/amino-acid acetyltransferase ArgJ [Persephonella atlantica]